MKTTVWFYVIRHRAKDAFNSFNKVYLNLSHIRQFQIILHAFKGGAVPQLSFLRKFKGSKRL